MTIVENLQRADLNPMEQARAYQRLSHDFKMTQEQMATRTGKERASVANFLRLLRLPEAIQHKVESGDLSFGHARTLLALDSPEAITAAAQKVMALNLSVRQTESYVQGLINPEAKEKKEAKARRNPKTPTSARPRTASAAPSASRFTSRTKKAKAASSSSTPASKTSTPSSPRSAVTNDSRQPRRAGRHFDTSAFTLQQRSGDCQCAT